MDKEWEKLVTISAWDLTEVRSKKEVIDEARLSGATVHFSSLMDKCHLKNAELEEEHQKYKGRVVRRSDMVKDDSGSFEVFTEQGSSASQMTAADILDNYRNMFESSISAVGVEKLPFPQNLRISSWSHGRSCKKVCGAIL